MILKRPQLLLAIICTIACFLQSDKIEAGHLYVGTESVSITPDQPVALDGQMATRISRQVETPCTATALAIETRDGDQSIDQAIFVSCDLVTIRGGDEFYNSVRENLKGRVPEFLFPKLIFNATHTHTGPLIEEGRYELPESGVMPPPEYRDFLMKRLANIIVKAWEKRAPARVAWGLGHAVVAQNRRAVYADLTSVMYGKTNNPDFRGMEGTEDHGVEILYFWNAEDQLIATSIDVPCPAQEVESRRAVNADFWHPVREMLRKKHGPQLNVIAWCSAAGDQSPHLMYRKSAEARMRKLRGLDSTQEIARRIVNTWEDVYNLVQKEKHDDVEFEHYVETIQLPEREISKADAKKARSILANLKEGDPRNHWKQRWHGSVIERYEAQQASPQFYDMHLHAVRLGDIAIVTNDFELFTDYGTQIKARSPALQTFVIQLCSSGSYVPSQRAVEGGGYSAVPESNVVGPKGAQVLVNETVQAIDKLFTKSESKKPADKK